MTKPIRIGVLRLVDSAPIIVAQSDGMFIDQGLPLLEQLAAAGGDAAAVGDEALKLLASEAGKGAACLYLLRDRLAAAVPASSAAA